VATSSRPGCDEPGPSSFICSSAICSPRIEEGIVDGPSPPVDDDAPPWSVDEDTPPWNADTPPWNAAPTVLLAPGEGGDVGERDAIVEEDACDSGASRGGTSRLCSWARESDLGWWGSLLRS